MARQAGLPFQITATLRVVAFVFLLSGAFLWFVLGRAHQQIEQSGRENFRLLAHSAFGEIDAMMQSYASYLGTVASLLPTMPDIYTEASSRALAQSFLDQAVPHSFAVTRPRDMLYFLKRDPEAPAGSAYTMGHFAVQADGSRMVSVSYYTADHRLLSQRRYSLDAHPEQSEWYLGALRSKGPYFSRPHLAPAWNSLAMTLALRSGESVVSMTSPLGLIDRLLERVPVSANGAALLFDDQHRIVAFRAKGERWKQLSQFRMKPVAQLGHPLLVAAAAVTDRLAEGQLSLVSLADQPFLLAWHAIAKIPGTQYRLLLLSPLADMSQAAETAKRDAWLVAIVGLMILLPLTWFSTGAMAGVLQRLVQQSERIGHLNFSPMEKQKHRRSAVREVRALEHAHDAMRDALAKGTRTLERVSGHLARLIGIGANLVKKKTRQALLEAVLEAAREMSSAEAAVLFLRDEDDKLRPVATLGMEPPHCLSALDMKLPEMKHQSLAVYTALSGVVHVVDDLDLDQREELVNLRKYNRERSSIRVKTIASLPLRTLDRVIGVMQVINARDADTDQIAPFSSPQVTYLEALAGQATVALENQKLIAAQTNLLDTLVRTLGDAVDAKSAYTGRHCARVPELAMMLAREANVAESGPLANFSFRTEEEWREFRVGAWLHDCGKITSPEHVLDKATKLETVYNRLHEIRTRFEVLLRDALIEVLQAQLAGRMNAETAEQIYAQRAAVLQGDYVFIAACNVGSENMAAADIARVQAIGKQTWLRNFDDRLGISYEEKERRQSSTPVSLPALASLIADQPWHLIPRPPEEKRALTEGFRMKVPEHLYDRGELYNLCIERGTLTREERFKINEHIIHTIRMLEGAKFPALLRRVPEYAGTHHEAMDGSGYPRGLTAAELSIPARIMAIADIFEALTASDRPYKPAKPLSESVAILHKMKLKGHVDPDLFNLFLRSGVYMRYAERFLAPEQIDLTDITPYLS
ncbi:HD domain-containing phosphohydrolase [Stenotrophobium rhamnosiphilum]|uniref:HD-GYP domain-containing protein n=1 Tax=Stenotrophobium rhamnosiphilum TaxID=2029166 RepID=A0A2T5MK89_9GAMM|nr:HD domain-containing phosphohydrolase [Stenotrophobium rhamnosiphilum]PTU32982.1 hypothetical protein CJD38_02385 [Stenotrophobium rhamnosiphilum]